MDGRTHSKNWRKEKEKIEKLKRGPTENEKKENKTQEKSSLYDSIVKRGYLKFLF